MCIRDRCQGDGDAGPRPRLTQLSVAVYHLDKAKLQTARDSGPGQHFRALRRATIESAHAKPVWETSVAGRLYMSGKYSAVANLKAFAESERKQRAQKQGIDPKLAGGVLFGSRPQWGNAHIPGQPLPTTGVVGNVIHLQAPEHSAYSAGQGFALSGIILVGRRIDDEPSNDAGAPTPKPRMGRRGSYRVEAKVTPTKLPSEDARQTEREAAST